jgi:hypothetical protein
MMMIVSVNDTPKQSKGKTEYAHNANAIQHNNNDNSAARNYTLSKQARQSLRKA